MATPGQPTSYKPEYGELAHNYCLLGATNEVAGFFGVTRTTLYQGKEHTITNTVSYPPDTQACMFWLRNRQRQYWRAKAEWRHRSPPTTWWRCSMPPARACAMPASKGPNIAITSGNCGNPRRRGAGKGARPAEAAATETALVEKIGRFRWAMSPSPSPGASPARRSATTAPRAMAARHFGDAWPPSLRSGSHHSRFTTEKTGSSPCDPSPGHRDCPGSDCRTPRGRRQ